MLMLITKCLYILKLHSINEHRNKICLTFLTNKLNTLKLIKVKVIR